MIVGSRLSAKRESRMENEVLVRLAFLMFVVFIARVLYLMVIGDFREVEPRAEDEAMVNRVRREHDNSAH